MSMWIFQFQLIVFSRTFLPSWWNFVGFCFSVCWNSINCCFFFKSNVIVFMFYFSILRMPQWLQKMSKNRVNVTAITIPAFFICFFFIFHISSLSFYLHFSFVPCFSQKQIILFASMFAVICASKDQLNDGGLVAAESGLTTNHIYSQPIQDNIAAESEVAKRGAASVSSSTSSASSGSESQGQSSQIDVGKRFWVLLFAHTM